MTLISEIINSIAHAQYYYRLKTMRRRLDNVFETPTHFELTGSEIVRRRIISEDKIF